MILPTKHIRPDRALIGVGAEVLNTLGPPMTMSNLWDNIRSRRSTTTPNPAIDYQWFVLALDLLYMIGIIELEDGLIRKVNA